jgi:hypothetical protein
MVVGWRGVQLELCEEIVRTSVVIEKRLGFGREAEKVWPIRSMDDKGSLGVLGELK